MRRGTRRGATVQGCLILTLALPIVATLGMYNAEKVPFHLAVAGAALVGCLVMSARDRRAEAAAFAVIALPASVSALLGYFGHLTPDRLKGISGMLYVAGPVVFVALAAFLALREEGKPPTASPPGAGGPTPDHPLRRVDSKKPPKVSTGEEGKFADPN